MDERAKIAARAASDLGGLPAGPFVPTDHVLLPWEKRTHALLDVLHRKKILHMEEKRRGVEELGRDTYDKLSYYEKWILAACNLLLAKGLITPEEIRHKLVEVAQREAGHGRQVCS